MKALFIKELRKGRWLPLFGMSVAVLVAVLRGMFGLYPPLLSTERMDDQSLFVLICFAGYIIAILGGAGLFASEKERGTLPVLLSLPLSRSRIWAAKVAAGFTLALCASLLLVLPSLLALPQVLGRGHDSSEFTLWLAPWWFVVFLASVLFSTMLEHLLSAFMGTVVFGLGLLALVAPMAEVWGGSLVGSDPADSIGVWALAMTPGLLLGSLIAFSRGEMLRSRSRWVLGVGVWALYAGTVVLLISGTVHWATRYERARVQEVEPVALSANGEVAGVVAKGWPIERTFDVDSSAPGRRRVGYRSESLVLTNLQTGRDLLTFRGGGIAAVSADGKLAAVMPQPFALTWWSPNDRPGLTELQVWDLTTKRMDWAKPFLPIHDGLRPYRSPEQAVEWSPKGLWLGMSAMGWRRAGDPWRGLQLVRRDGSDARVVSLWPPSSRYVRGRPQGWVWDGSDEAVYALVPDTKESAVPIPGLVRISLPRGRESVLCTLDDLATRLSSGYEWVTADVSVSPGSGSIAFALLASPIATSNPVRTRPREPLLLVFLIARDGARKPALLSQTPAPRSYGSPGFTWSKDGKRLYYISVSDGEPALWRADVAAAVARALPDCRWTEKIATLPGSDNLLVWSPNMVWLVNARDGVQQFPNDAVRRLAHDHLLLGMNDQGQAIVAKRAPGFNEWQAETLGVLNLATGRVKQVYP
ncbi:MAG TPA: ABC transporter permease subunit [Armatimonadota bacterium]|nr:ABC transporter permease subunit [Armatimonadota bacterium]